MALLGGPRKDIDPYLADDIASETKARCRGDHAGPRELDRLADRAADLAERLADARWS